MIGDTNGQIQIYNFSSLSFVNSFQAHSNYINRIKQSPFNTNYVATCSNDVKIWSVSSSFDWTLITTYSQHSSLVFALEWLDNDTLASGSLDKTIKLWNLTNGFCIKTFIGHNDWVRKLCIINNNFASCGNETSILIWEKNNN